MPSGLWVLHLNPKSKIRKATRASRKSDIKIVQETPTRIVIKDHMARYDLSKATTFRHFGTKGA
jgi:hypothetical protein